MRSHYRVLVTYTLLVGAIFVESPALASIPTYITGNAPRAEAQYGVYGHIHVHPWPAYYNWLQPNVPVPEKNVSSLYLRRSLGGYDSFIEIGLVNDWWSWNDGGRVSSRPAQVFMAYENGPYLSYRQYNLASAIPDTWIAFEINNHARLGQDGIWYAAWNGNTVLHGLSTIGFVQGQAQGAAELNNPAYLTWVSAKSSYRYLQWQRIQGNFAPFSDAYFVDYLEGWKGVKQSGYTNYYHVLEGW